MVSIADVGLISGGAMAAFEEAQYRARIDKVKRRMEAAGIDVLLASHPANMNYLSGYDGWSYYVHQLVALALAADRPVWIGREMDIAGAKATVWMDHARIHGYPDECVDSSDQHPMTFIAGVLKDL